MIYDNIGNKIEQLCIIINHGLGSKVVKVAKKYGILGAMMTYGKGTVHNSIMDYMGLTDMRKEVIFLIVESENIENVCDGLNRKFHFEKPNHGIIFSTEVSRFVGKKRVKCCLDGETERLDYEFSAEDRIEMHNNHDMITVIVDKGRAEEAIEAAKKAGSRGGTIVNARGSGFEAACKVFAMEIEPEKEIVIIISQCDETEKIIDSIDKDLNTDRPNSGIIYVQNLKRAYGIYGSKESNEAK